MHRDEKKPVSIPIRSYIEQKTKNFTRKKKIDEIYTTAYKHFKYLLFSMLFGRF
jgi:hypothetical protein